MIDISIPLASKMLTYPGNPKFSKKSKRTKTSTISTITLGTHTGTHIDAPKHVFKKGMPIDSYNLNVFNGIVRVIDCTRSEKSVSVEVLKKIK
jgi:arylformamidase